MAAPRPGPDSGSVIERNTLQGPAPRLRAACSRRASLRESTSAISWYANGKNAIVWTPQIPPRPKMLMVCPKIPYVMRPRGPNRITYAAATTNGGESSGRMPIKRKNGFHGMFV